MAGKESLLKKEFKSSDVNRVRNIVNKDFTGKTISGIGYTKAHEARNEGDVWEENGRTWTIKDGVRQNITKLDTAKKMLQVPLACPKCGGSMNYHLHKKMYKIHKMCFDCVIDYEAELRKAGLYESYEKAMIQGGVKAFIAKIEDWMLDNVGNSDTFVTEQGDIESWDSNSKKTAEDMNETLKEFIMHIKKHAE